MLCWAGVAPPVAAQQNLEQQVDEVTRRVLSDPFTTLRFVALALETPDEQGQALNGIVRAMLAREDLEGALSEVSRIEDLLWNARSLVAIGDYQAELSNYSAALKYYDEAVEKIRAIGSTGPGEIDVLRTTAVKQAGLGRLKSAIGTAGRIPDAVDRVQSLQEAARSSFDGGDGDQQATLASGRVLRAAYEAAKLIKSNDGRTAEIIMAIGDSQTALDDIEGAQATFRHARQVIERGPLSSRNQSYAKLSSSMIGANMLEEAMEVVRLVERGPYQVRALSSVARALGDQGNMDAAVPLFTLAKEAAPGIEDEVKRANAISFMIRQQVHVGRYADAFNAAGAISDSRLQSEALLGMAEELLRQGKAEAALVLVDYIPFIGMRAQIFSRAALMKAVAGNKPEAQALLARAFEPTGYEPFADYVPEAATIVLETQLKIGDPETDEFMFGEIRKLADLIGDELVRLDVMSRLATAEAMRGWDERANRTLSSAWRNAWLNRRDPKFPDILEGIVEGQIAVGDILSAFDTAARIPKPAEEKRTLRTPSGEFIAPRFRSLTTVAVAASRGGETDLGIRAAREIDFPPARAAALAAIAVAIAEEQVKQGIDWRKAKTGGETSGNAEVPTE